MRRGVSGRLEQREALFYARLPTETDEDVLGIAELADRVVHCWRENSPNRSHGLRVTVSTSCFVPKPHTPFQWEPQVTREEYMRRVTLLRDNMKARAVTYNWHDADTSLTEAVLSRGDRRLGAMIENIWRQGGFLESWSEGFDLKRWERAGGGGSSPSRSMPTANARSMKCCRGIISIWA